MEIILTIILSKNIYTKNIHTHTQADTETVRNRLFIGMIRTLIHVLCVCVCVRERERERERERSEL